MFNTTIIFFININMCIIPNTFSLIPNIAFHFKQNKIFCVSQSLLILDIEVFDSGVNTVRDKEM
jgi:hypothetical protein